MSAIAEAAPAVDAGSSVELRQLVVRPEDDEVVVGRPETSEFVVLPPVGGRVIELLQQGKRVGEIAAALEQETGEEIDVAGFIAELVELGFVAAVDGHVVAEEAPAQPTLPRLEARHVRWLFGTWAKAAYAALLAAALVSVAREPRLVPSYGDFFWWRVTSVVLAVNTLIFVVNIALHEFSHLIAARSLGVPGRISLGTRLHHLVAQTDVTGLWAVPRRQRYRVYWAGIAWDLVPIAVSLLLLAYAPLPSRARDVLEAVVLVIGLGTLRQFFFYMRTDVYLVLLDLLRCGNLFNDALAYLRFRGRALLGRAERGADPRLRLPARERRPVTVYAWLVLVGSALALGSFAVYGLPILLTLFYRAGSAIVNGARDADVGRIADGAVALVVQGTFTGAFLVIFVRNHLRTRALLGRALRSLGRTG